MSKVKQYTRQDGTIVKEHEDSRQAAHKASASAERHRSKMTWEPNDPNLGKHADLHDKAAIHHLAAYGKGMEAGDEEARHHMYAASSHLSQAHSARSFGGDHAGAADKASRTAKVLSAAAHSREVAEDGKSIDHASALHLLAMEQHQRAYDAHRNAANRSFNDDTATSDKHMKAAKHHEAEAKKHGEKVREITKAPIAAGDKARALGKTAKTSTEHAAAAEAHAKAASMNYDKELIDEHQKMSEHHGRKAHEATQAEAKASVKSTPEKPAKPAPGKTTDGDKNSAPKAAQQLQKLANKHEDKMTRKPTELRNISNDPVDAIPASELKGMEAHTFEMKDAYFGVSSRIDNEFGRDFQKGFLDKVKAHGTTSFILKDSKGNRYLIDTQGGNYPRYAARINEGA